MAQANGDQLVGDVAGPCVFRKEGEYWTIAYAGSVFRLRDAKGMSYLAHLLGRPGERIPALVLCTLTGGNGSDADAERARLAVTQRIRAALKKVHSHNASLGHHLSTCIRTGHVCAYVPDPGRPVEWVL